MSDFPLPNVEHLVKFAQESRYETRFADILESAIRGFTLTYAEQQNTAFVAQIKSLRAAEQSYCRRISSLEKDIKSLQRSAAIRDTKLAKAKAHADLMQAENERLKQQLANFKNAAQKALSQPAEHMDLLNMFHDA